MQLGTSSRKLELSLKMQQAIAKNPEVWKAALKNAKPGEPIAYDPRLGLTKSEYHEYLSLGFKLKKTSITARVKIAQEGHLITMHMGSGSPKHDKVVIDMKSNTVITPLGVAGNFTRVEPSEDQKATGPWEGIEWKFEKFDKETDFPKNATIVKFALGKLKATGRGFMYYDAKVMQNEKPQESFSWIIEYDIKPLP